MIYIRAIKDAVRVLLGRIKTAQDIYDGYLEWGFDAFTSESKEDFAETNRAIGIVYRAAKIRGLKIFFIYIATNPLVA